MKSGMARKSGLFVGILLAGSGLSWSQASEPAASQPVAEQTTAAPAYQPKFAGDPAHSDAEAGALGYIRTVLMAQRIYKKKHGGFATSLSSLVHIGSFTQRMTKTDRGDYTVSFHAEPKGAGFSIAMTPKQFDPAHRAFYSDDTGIIRAETDKPATENSDRVK